MAGGTIDKMQNRATVKGPAFSRNLVIQCVCFCFILFSGSIMRIFHEDVGCPIGCKTGFILLIGRFQRDATVWQDEIISLSGSNH